MPTNYKSDYRYTADKYKDPEIFSKHADKTHVLNTSRPMRGGIRL